jgi:acyl-CoA synthetase (AMP-forming)/AMP-acid ligase II
VVGVDDPEWGQRVVAVVVARRPVEPQDLRQWVRDRLAAHKVPKDVYLVDTLPRNALGKTLKQDVMRLVTEWE